MNFKKDIMVFKLSFYMKAFFVKKIPDMVLHFIFPSFMIKHFKEIVIDNISCFESRGKEYFLYTVLKFILFHSSQRFVSLFMLQIILSYFMKLCSKPNCIFFFMKLSHFIWMHFFAVVFSPKPFVYKKYFKQNFAKFIFISNICDKEFKRFQSYETVWINMY